MPSLARLTVFLSYISHVWAKDESLHYGWQPEPQGRGTWSILWGCIATILICTWSALHLDVPRRNGILYSLFRKFRWMVVAAMAPEYILLLSAYNFFNSRDVLRHLTKNGFEGWTLTHMQFAAASGFRNHTPFSVCDLWKLRDLIENGDITHLPISEDELKSRGKSDVFVKTLALLQIIWFVVQILVRAIQHYPITALEIMTGAFVFCSLFTYAFSWYQPQDVECPVDIRYQDAEPGVAQSWVDWGWSLLVGMKGRKGRKGRKGYNPAWATEVLPMVFFLLSACGFGAIHCLAWDSPFVTPQERLAWRVSSTASTALPALGIMFWEMDTDLSDIFFYPTIAFYVLARITMIVPALMGLRVLPTDVFQTLNWNLYLPHLAA